MRMRPWLACALAMTMLAAAVPTVHSQSVFDKLKQKAKDKVDQKEDQATDSAVNAADPTDKSGNSGSTRAVQFGLRCRGPCGGKDGLGGRNGRRLSSRSGDADLVPELRLHAGRHDYLRRRFHDHAGR